VNVPLTKRNKRSAAPLRSVPTTLAEAALRRDVRPPNPTVTASGPRAFAPVRLRIRIVGIWVEELLAVDLIAGDHVLALR
jgi:hypothetical protein